MGHRHHHSGLASRCMVPSSRIPECCGRCRRGVGGPGWSRWTDDSSVREATSPPVSRGLLQAFLGSVAVYAALLATGSGLYGDSTLAVALASLAGISGWGVLKLQALTHAS